MLTAWYHIARQMHSQSTGLDVCVCVCACLCEISNLLALLAVSQKHTIYSLCQQYHRNTQFTRSVSIITETHNLLALSTVSQKHTIYSLCQQYHRKTERFLIDSLKRGTVNTILLVCLQLPSSVFIQHRRCTITASDGWPSILAARNLTLY